MNNIFEKKLYIYILAMFICQKKNKDRRKCILILFIGKIEEQNNFVFVAVMFRSTGSFDS